MSEALLVEYRRQLANPSLPAPVRAWLEAQIAQLQAAESAIAPSPSIYPSTSVETTTERVRRTALGQLGDPRPGVCDLNIDWCAVPAGDYVLGSADSDLAADDNEKPLQTVALPAFRISRYPVTNAQWQLFMAAGGYADQRWWGEQGWIACQEGWDWTGMDSTPTGIPWTQPRYWADLPFNGLNQPVVGVSWYEAVALCAWLSDQCGTVITLPTEAHWEAAARGPQRLIYAWGDEWNAEKANTAESSLNCTTVVGSYPQGASWCGALDLTGNVWEWTSSDFKNPDRMNSVVNPTNSMDVSYRGGAWDLNRQGTCCAVRDGFTPLFRVNDLGVRIVTPLQV